MEVKNKNINKHMPKRFKNTSILPWLCWIIFLAFIAMGLNNADISFERLGNRILNIGSFLSSAFPPDFTRSGSILLSILETLEMALVGTTIGVILSLPLALLA